MTQKAKAEFSDFGITVGKIGNQATDLLKAVHQGSLHYVGDVNTIAAAKALLPADVEILEFPEPPKADDKTVELIRREMASADVIVAVGSGTLNDLCKYASFLDDKPYSVIATAPSMNGYVSANASITVQGYKQTLAAHAPQAVICDMDVLAAAPERLKQAGLGDTLCRSTVQADWLLSHLLLGTPYEPKYFDALIECETRLLDNPTDSEALIEALLLSGLAMRDFGSSAPASQGEHMIAHMMEMLHPDLPASYHGEQIAVTSLTMARRQEALLQCDKVRVRPLEEFNHLPLAFHQQAQKEFFAKFPSAGMVEQLNVKLATDWPEIVEQMRAIQLPAEVLEQALARAGCSIAPQVLGWNESDYKKATQLARFTRNRFTFLDIEKN